MGRYDMATAACFLFDSSSLGSKWHCTVVHSDAVRLLQRLIELEQAESCLREQMQALQRKLVRTVTENEALLHVVDKLQFSVLALRRQLHRAGLTPDVVVDDALLRLAPHQVGTVLAASKFGRHQLLTNFCLKCLHDKQQRMVQASGATVAFGHNSL